MTVAPIAPPSAGAPRRRLLPRHLWLIPGLAVGVYASSQASQHALGLLPLLVQIHGGHHVRSLSH